MKKNIILINRDLGLRDILSLEEYKDKHFRDVASYLKEKYESKILDFVSKNLANQVEDLDRIPIHFSYIGGGDEEESGREIPVDHSEPVAPIINLTSEGQIFWSIPAIGGRVDFRQIFGNHAASLISLSYQNWKFITEGYPGYGIYSRGPDKNGIVRKITIQPTEKYPYEPPLVVSAPPFSEDPCWDDKGVLHYTYWTNNGGSPWTDLVYGRKRNKKVIAQASENPLKILVSELMQKYSIGV